MDDRVPSAAAKEAFVREKVRVFPSKVRASTTCKYSICRTSSGRRIDTTSPSPYPPLGSRCSRSRCVPVQGEQSQRKRSWKYVKDTEVACLIALTAIPAIGESAQ